MEKDNFRPLATESFSFSWLTEKNLTSSLDSYLSSKFTKAVSDKEPSFNFDFSITTSSSSTDSLIHADEIFSDGQIMPIYIEKSQPRARKTSNYASTPPPDLYSPITPFSSRKNHHCTLGKWTKSTKRIVQKCIEFVRPLCKTSSSRKSNRVDDLDRKVSEVKSWNNSREASPRPSSAHSVFELADVEKIKKKINLFHGPKRPKNGTISTRASPLRSPSRPSDVSFDAENSIHEAILYCKRSLEK